MGMLRLALDSTIPKIDSNKMIIVVETIRHITGKTEETTLKRCPKN
jgi:hypothetical protein